MKADDLISSDSNDSDIFIVEHIKPSCQKHKSENNDFNSVTVDKKEVSMKLNHVLKKKSETEKHVIRTKSHQSVFNDAKFFSSPNNKNIELSPTISKKRNHFKIKDVSPHKNKKLKLSLHKSFDEMKNSSGEKIVSKNALSLGQDKDNFNHEIKFTDDSLSHEFENDFLLNDFESEIDEKVKNEKYRGNSALLCFLFKKLINDERKKQKDLQESSMKNGIIIEKLLSESECEIYDKFLNLEENACKVFVRMLGRKKDWHRVSVINYKDIGTNLKTEFEILHKENFIDTEIEKEDLKIQMSLLSKPEVLKLCKDFNIPTKFTKNNKNELINYIIESNRKQRSVYDMFKGKSSSGRLESIKNKVNSCLGMCVRINDKIFQAFYKILVLFSFAHYSDEENKRFQKELFLHYQVQKNMIKFPSYKVSPTAVFETLEDFEEYLKSLLLQDIFKEAVNNKNYDEFDSAFSEAKTKFKNLLENTEYVNRFSNLAPFLKKFSAGTVYARIITKYCKTFKRKTDTLNIVNTTQLLLGQNVFLTGKTGEWYDILSKALTNQKQYDAAAEALIDGLQNPSINEVQKLTLQLRGQTILKKKTQGIKDVQLRKKLDDLCTSSVYEPLLIEIKGKALEGNESGFKSVYIQEFKNKTVYSSVEERAISHYKLNGFTKGYHSEGFIIHTLYFLFLFDIIYDSSPQGVFQSQYQEAPLDLYSTCFYKNRKDSIDLLLNEMLNWNNEQIKFKINKTYYENNETTCVIKWNDEFTPEVLCELIECISMQKLILIFQRFLKSFRVFRSGFPDLTMWNPETKRCKFVEVKSPSDKLSPAQRVWLDYLRSIQLDCEVCNIKNSSSKSLS